MEFECCLFLFLFKKKSSNIKNMVQIRPILYSSQPIILQIFFYVNDKDSCNSGLLIFITFETLACKFLVLETARKTWFIGLVDVCFESGVTLCYTSFGKVRFKFFAYYANRNLFSKCLFFHLNLKLLAEVVLITRVLCSKVVCRPM